MKQEIKLGDKVRDRVTGYEGIATSKTEFLNGCIQIEVTQRFNKKDKISPELLAGLGAGMGIDIGQLQRIGNGLNIPEKKVVKKSTGGPMRRVTRRLY